MYVVVMGPREFTESNFATNGIDAFTTPLSSSEDDTAPKYVIGHWNARVGKNVDAIAVPFRNEITIDVELLATPRSQKSAFVDRSMSSEPEIVTRSERICSA